MSTAKTKRKPGGGLRFSSLALKSSRSLFWWTAQHRLFFSANYRAQSDGTLWNPYLAHTHTSPTKEEGLLASASVSSRCCRIALVVRREGEGRGSEASSVFSRLGLHFGNRNGGPAISACCGFLVFFPEKPAGDSNQQRPQSKHPALPANSMGQPGRRRCDLLALGALLLVAHNGRTADAQAQIVVATPATSKETGEDLSCSFSYSGSGGEDELSYVRACRTVRAFFARERQCRWVHPWSSPRKHHSLLLFCLQFSLISSSGADSHGRKTKHAAAADQLTGTYSTGCQCKRVRLPKRQTAWGCCCIGLSLGRFFECSCVRSLLAIIPLWMTAGHQ